MISVGFSVNCLSFAKRYSLIIAARNISGGLLLGAIFMATDYSTSPAAWGKVLFGISAGLLTVLIRFYGAYAKGRVVRILFMNILMT